jgi:hypothetical protein
MGSSTAVVAPVAGDRVGEVGLTNVSEVVVMP